MLSKATKVEPSPRKFDQANLILTQKEAPTVEVNDIGTLAVNQQVTVMVKVNEVGLSENGEKSRREGVGEARLCHRGFVWLYTCCGVGA